MEQPLLLKHIVDFLEQNRLDILMDAQSKFCGPCGGIKVSHVYRSPAAARLGSLLDDYKKATQRG